MMRSTDARLKSVQGPAREDTRDIALFVMMLVFGWASMSCSSASVQETCARADSWDQFGSYEECMAAGADPSRMRAPAQQDAAQGQRAPQKNDRPEVGRLAR